MKIIFLDADGTLFHHEGYIPISAIEACKQAQANGHKICLCTGRQRVEIFGDMLKIDYDAIIAGSGAWVECEHHVLEDNSFTKEEKGILTSYIESHYIPATYESSHAIYGTSFTKHIMLEKVKQQCSHLSKEDQEKHGLYILTHQIQVIDDPSKIDFNKISFIDHSIKYENIYNALHHQFDVIPATFAPLGKESGEIASKNISKATGMKTVMKYFNNEDSIAIGDGHNDLPMFEIAKYSIAMANAPEEVKIKADAITSTLDDDGIYNAFKKMHLI